MLPQPGWGVGLLQFNGKGGRVEKRHEFLLNISIFLECSKLR